MDPHAAENAQVDEKLTEEDGKKEDMEKVEETIETGKASLHDSEYESVGSGEHFSENEIEPHQVQSGNDSGHSGSDSDDQSVILEREEGDGQESAPSRKVDDDQDKKNPQYIPKRGTFYEHDDRTADDIEVAEEVPEKPEKEPKKKVWSDKKEKWSHDKFNDTEQAPKSRQELIAIYGYDIRNEDGPPRARRRRRYGRGPNKYTRNWEDEEAYNKPPLKKNIPPRKPRNKSEDSGQSSKSQDQKYESKESNSNNNQIEDYQDQSNGANRKSETRFEPPKKEQQKVFTNNHNRQEAGSHNKSQSRIGSGRVSKPQKDIKDSDYRGFTKSRQFKSSKQESLKSGSFGEKKGGDKDYSGQSQSYEEKWQHNAQDLEKDMNKLNVNDGGGFKNRQATGGRQGSMPPRLQGENKKSKRYSSIRQRSLPETANPPVQLQHSNFYSNEYNQQTTTANQQPPLLHQPSSIHTTSNQMPQIAPPPLAPIPQQGVPVSSAPILQAPPQYGAAFPQAPPAFLQPTVAPAPFIPQQTPSIINYVQSQQFPQGPYQTYQQPFNPVTQPGELYQPQGGITYYSPQEQQATQRTVPPKRPKAAIPIVAPPPQEPRGRGRANQSDAGPNSTPELTHESGILENANQFEDASTVAVQQ